MRRSVPAFGTALLALAGCSTQPTYTYGPASYATPPAMLSAPGRPYPLPDPVLAAPLPPPGTFLPDRPPPDAAPVFTPLEPEAGRPAPSEIAPPLAPSAALDPPPFVDAPAAPNDPVTDLLLAPPGQRGAAEPAAAVSKKPSPAEANPMMGFRPMRGQTAPSL